MHLGNTLFFGTGGPLAAVYSTHAKCESAAAAQCSLVWQPAETPIAHGAAAAGVFSLAGRTTTSSMSGKMTALLVAVGGIYDKPDDASASASLSSDGGQHWTLSTAPPHGYRSAVAYDRNTGSWITVGPNGTDISTDDGRNWRALKPSPIDAPDADQHWNALSLPFVVGPHGRIGLLNPTALTTSH
jgi:hypothetical protein